MNNFFDKFRWKVQQNLVTIHFFCKTKGTDKFATLTKRGTIGKFTRADKASHNMNLGAPIK